MNTEDGERQSTSSIRDPVPQYEGEDVRPTSKQELAGWYSYGWAAEVFTVCAMGSFLPITLEQMARNQGYLLSDPSTPCTSTWKTGNEGFSAASGSELTANSSSATGEQCFIWLFNTKINTASFAMYTFSISVAVQSLLIISMSGAADHGVFRKKFLLAFAMMGSVSLMLFIAIRYYLVAGLIAIISNTCFGASFVLLNSFLPLLVRHHPLTREAKEQRSNSITVGAQQASEHSPLLQDQRDGDTARDAKPQATSTELMLSTEISSWGIGIGYVGSLLLLIISIGIVVATGSTTFSLRLVLFAVGMWWLLFTIPAWLWLRPRPGPPLPGLTASQSTSERWVWVRYLTFAWKSLGRTALSIRHLKDVLLFLLAWFCLSDGIATVSGTAVLFAKTQLNMNVAALGMINVTAMLAGVFGAFMWNWISRICNWNATQTIIACICLFEVIPIYGLLGFVPQVQRLGHLGLQEPWEMYPLSAVYGMVMGGLSSYCRSLFGELIPPGFEASFYALYAITDKGSSMFGPAVVGAITDRFGQIRPAFWFLAFLIFLPLPLMLLVDIERGRKDALLLSQKLEERESQEEPQ